MDCGSIRRLRQPPSGHISGKRDSSISTDFSPARKRSLTIAGHSTSIRLESLFWDALVREAKVRGLPVNALVAQIDAERLATNPPPNLASAIRLWLFAHHTGGDGA